MRRSYLRPLLSQGLVAVCVVCGAHAQVALDLAARLHAAASESSIDKEGLLPWHLKLDVQLYDAKGVASEQGSIEEWWGGPSLRHVVYTMPSFKGSYIQKKDQLFLSGSGSGPVILDDLLEQIVHPMPHENEIDQSKPELRKEKFGKVDLDCIMLDQPLKNVPFPPMGLFPTFCLDPGKDSLRITTELGSITFIRNRVGTFQKQMISTDISGNAGNVQVASAHVNTLTTVGVSDADFAPGPDMQLASDKIARIDGGLMAGFILAKVQPVYPERAKLHHIAGSVILHATIGRDGRVQSLHLVSTQDSDLAIAAVVAVRQWRYKPYLLNGLPVEVDTTITVNFSFRPS